MSAKPRHTQPDMFPAGEDLPLFSGACTRGQPATFQPRAVWTQTSILDLPEFVVTWEHRHEYHSRITLARLLARLGYPNPLSVIASVDNDPGLYWHLFDHAAMIFRLDSPHRPTNV